ncbi:MAG TPA: M48 family metallopeptidase [Steroidobacteraceae bacterium]|nr:M48 family metallopeptidase [Steroidobacteraceae bacterium]
MIVAGRYFDGRTSAGVEARLEFGADGKVHVYGTAEPIVAPLAEIGISERVGNITRRITFPGGGVFETQDNDAVDRARESFGMRGGSALVHWLESRWQVAVGSLVAVVLVSIAFVQWGVPAAANWAAEVMPADVDRAIGAGSLDVLDRVAFEPSGLPKKRQQELRGRFVTMTKPLDDGHVYQLEFRHGGHIGANAFALPSGIIVMTDELVELAKTDDEIVSVLAHEIGHVRGRHALRHLLQAAGISSLAFALLGDVSTISGVLSAAPALLHAKNSRDFEREADAFAKQWLRENGIAESSFDSMLCRLNDSHGGGEEDDDFDYFSSHPATSERAQCSREEEPEAAAEDAKPAPEDAPVEADVPVEEAPLIDTPREE